MPLVRGYVYIVDQRRTGSNRTAIAALRLGGLCLALGVAACGGGGGPAPDPGPGPQRGTLNGTVRDAGGAALSGVAVLLGQSAAVTDAAGQFQYDNLLAGSYTLSLQDSAGNFDCRNVIIAAGDSSLDFTLPRSGSGLLATEVYPALNGTGSALDSTLYLSFSQELDYQTITADDFSITPEIGAFAVGPPPAVAGRVSQIEGRTDTVVITPQLQLPANQVTYVELTGEISALGGEPLSQPVRWRFRTAATDTFPPRLLGSTPADGASNHPPNSPVLFEYSEPLAEPDGETTVTVAPETEVTVYASGRTLVISPIGQWEINTDYTISAANVADAAGNRSAGGGAAVSFTTGAQASPRNHVEPEWNRILNLIFFAADQAGSYDIFSVEPTTGAILQRTTLPGDEREPTVSSDGSLLAFQHRTPGGKWSIWVVDLAGGEPQQITTTDYNDTQPQFSRTISDRIVFVSDRSDPRGLYLMNSDGSNPVEQDRDFYTSQTDPALHPLLDTQMLFAAGGAGNRDIWRKSVSAVDGSVINQNYSLDNISDEHSPAWGPDADFIVYISDYSGVANLWFAEATGEFDVQLTGFSTAVLDVSVEPLAGGGRAVLSIADGPGGSQLVLVDLLTGEPLGHLTGEEAGD